MIMVTDYICQSFVLFLLNMFCVTFCQNPEIFIWKPPHNINHFYGFNIMFRNSCSVEPGYPVPDSSSFPKMFVIIEVKT